MIKFDLTGLNNFDVFVSHSCGRVLVRFATENLFTQYASSLNQFKQIGLQVFGADRETLSTVDISATDITTAIAVAERIASTFEGAGLRVCRLASDPSSVDKTPRIPVQSFILS